MNDIFTSYPDILTVKEVCEMIRLSAPSVYNLLHSGRIRCVKAGKRLIIPKASVIAFIKAER